MEINMKSNNHEGEKLKKTLHLKAKKPDTKSLRSLSQLLSMPHRLSLTRKYGKILNLLEVEEQVEAITALAQYYDPPLRCFTFQDFQLAPTLEEFERILGLPLEGEKPYHYQGHYPSLHTIAAVLNINVRDLHEAQKCRNGTNGFPKDYLEKHMHGLAGAKDWDTFLDVLALTVYGIVLFPNIEGFVDFAAIDVFLARKFHGHNPVPALLADVYCTLNFCYERNGKRILCCLPMLYVWVTAHVFQRNYKAPCPIEDLKMHHIKKKNGQEWAQDLAKLSEKMIRWYPWWEDGQTLIYQCGNFSNVPLMGTRGCINYNPVLVLRQLGYPMMGPPPEAAITPFILYYQDFEDLGMLQKVRFAWNKVVRKGKELGVRSCAVKESYRQWVKNRAQEIKLPFRTWTATPPNKASSSHLDDDEEIKEIKEKLDKIKQEKMQVEAALESAHHDYADLKRENTERNQILEGTTKKLKMGYEHMMKTKECLQAANKELGLRRQERDRAITENQQLRKLLQDTKIAEETALAREEQRKQEIREISKEYQRKAGELKQHMKYETMKFQAALEEEKKRVTDLEFEVQHQSHIIHELKTRFSNLAGLANTAIEDVPRYLEIAEQEVIPFKTPVGLRNFVSYCKDLVGRMKHIIAERS